MPVFEQVEVARRLLYGQWVNGHSRGGWLLPQGARLF